jgi:hypothetical protein
MQKTAKLSQFYTDSKKYDDSTAIDKKRLIHETFSRKRSKTICLLSYMRKIVQIADNMDL